MAELVGVFGGTFDPPHIGHLVLADEARAALSLEKVLWVVTGVPPHKPEAPRAGIDARLAMVTSAIEMEAWFEVSRADVDRPPPHYAVGTMAWLRRELPGQSFAYLMGSDSLAELPRWHQPEKFLAACELLGVMRRPGAAIDMEGLESQLPGLRAKCRVFDAPQVGISARDIRRRVAQGLPYRYMVPRVVADTIRRRSLYVEASREVP